MDVIKYVNSGAQDREERREYEREYPPDEKENPFLMEANTWMGRVADYGCMACRWRDGDFVSPFPPASVHHLQGRKRDDFQTIGLCPTHHQHGEDAIHRNKKLFRKTFLHEDDLYLLMVKVFERKGIIK